MAGNQGSGGGGVTDGLKKVFTQVGQLKLLPDSPQHLQFLSQLEQGIMAYLQQQAQKAIQGATQGGMGGGMGGPPMGGPPGAGGGPQPPMAGPPSPGGPGGPGGGAMGGLAISPDDLQRVLGGARGVTG